MAGQRVFLGWSRPALQQAADLLVQRSRSARVCDLSHLIAVVPGRRAGRRLLELLTEAAGGNLVPPRILTQGRLPEELYPPQRPFASDLVQKLVWSQALRTVPEATLSHIARQPPAEDDFQAWLRLGDLMRRQHLELAADRLEFADVAREGVLLDGFDEAARWDAMSQVQQRYWKLLDELQFWDQQTARLVAIRQRECRTELDIVTIGTVDLNRTLRAMLDQVADRVTAYIDAPESWADRFDAYGCLISEYWSDLKIDLAPEQLVMADDASAQVDAIVETLTGLNGQYSMEEITIGVPDSRLVPLVQRSLLAEGVPTHWPVDRPVPSTAPYRLLEAAVNFLEDHRTESFSELIRHPDMSQWLNRQNLSPDWLSHWDQFVCSYLTPRVEWFPDTADDRTVNVARHLYRTVQSLLVPLASSKVKLSASAEPVREFLLSIYGDRSIDPRDPDESRLRDVLLMLQEAFDSHVTLPSVLDLEMSVVDVVRLTMSMMGGELYRTQHEAAIQLSGWLDLPLDDSPVTIVTTFNEGYVPESVNHDLFLPNRLRAHLGLEDNTRRYARDLYNVVCMIHSRKVLRLIVSRRDAMNEPLTPSRLAFATEDENIPERVLRFYAHRGRQGSRGRSHGTVSQFKIPRPSQRESVPKIFRVTELRDYLASPYRYYLRHVLRLNVSSDAVTELDGAAFGVLVHDVLNSFGISDCRDTTSAVEIGAYLQQKLKESIEENYGPSPLAAVLIQMEQARRRLMAFADWQSEWRREGWVIYSVERDVEIEAPGTIANGKQVTLRGRIDRVDYHPDTGRWALFDYKTGDAGNAPDKTHRSQGEWCDLQLPLYRHLAADFGAVGDVRLGYIVLPRDTNYVQALFGDWSAEELAEADEVARDVIGNILEERFWKVLPEPSGSLTEYDAICQEGVFGREAVL
ncbi:PD-(D/E)XK nuclease family protein [Planctomicrobium sp. SH527]|uniref:PD-(D/E)XK nuclease family protein n=1 Tax=Planctomicrobium sp. SH527 TaxID=3448123 RepID=UPI003F5B9B4B